MKRFVMAFAVCFVFIICGCLSIDDFTESDGGAPARADTVRSELEPGVFFRWSSAKNPMRGTLGSTPVDSGYGGIVFRANGGEITTTDKGAFRLGSDVRLVIGATNNTTSSASAHVPGSFNFSNKSFRITVDYEDIYYPETGRYALRVAVNNNHTGQNNCVLTDSASNLGQYSLNQLGTGIPASGLKPGVTTSVAPGKLVTTVNPQVLYAGNAGSYSLGTAFVVLICQGGNRITITGITIEEVN